MGIIELTVTCKSEITIEDEGIMGSSVDFQTIVDGEHQTIMSLALDELSV